MSASPTQPANSAKRPLEETSSPSQNNEQPEAKRPALDNILKNDEEIPVAEKPDDTVAEANENAPTEPSNGVKSEAEGGAATTEEPKPITSTVPAAAPDAAATHDETAWIHIRAVISSPEAATIIGKGGENVSNIRKMSGAKCTVSDYQKGAVERILTVSGVVDAVAKVCGWPPRRFVSLNIGCANLLTSHVTGFRSHHPDSQQRAPRRGVQRPIQDVSPSTPHSAYPHRIHHWKGWCANP